MKSTTSILFLLALCSCQLVTEVEVPAMPERLVVNCAFRTGFGWHMDLSKTKYILDEHWTSGPADARVTISNSAGDVVELKLRGESYLNVLSFSSDSTDTVPLPGEVYTIRVSAKGFAPVTSTTRAPTQIQLINVRLDSANMIAASSTSGGSIPLEITFDDPSGEVDYYYPQFAVWSEFERISQTGYPEKFQRFDRRVLTNNPRNEAFYELEREVEVFSDEGFDGKRKTVRLYVNTNRLSPDEPKAYKWTLALFHAPEEYYKYFNTLKVQEENSGNPFAQPVQVYSNIKDGYGIFAGVNLSTWTHE